MCVGGGNQVCGEGGRESGACVCGGGIRCVCGGGGERVSGVCAWGGGGGKGIRETIYT